MNRLITLTLLASLALPAQIAAPQVGYLRDRSGSLRTVLGVAGSLVLGDVIEEHVVAAGFGSSEGFAKTSNELIVISQGTIVQRFDAPSGGAFFYFDAKGRATAVYFPEAQELWKVRKGGFDREYNVYMPEPSARADQDEVVLRDGRRVRMPERVHEVEHLGDGWFVAHCASTDYALRLDDKEIVITQLPERSGS